MRLTIIFFAMAMIFAVVSGAEAKRESWSAEKAVQHVCSGSASVGAPNGPAIELEVSSIHGGLRFHSDYEFEPVDAPLWKACMNDREQAPCVRLFAAHFLLDQDEDARKLVLAALASENLRYRYNAAKAVDIHVRHNPKAEWGIEILIGLIEDGSLESVQRGKQLHQPSPIDSICFTLGSVKSKKAVPALIGLLERRPGSRTSSAANALGDIGDERAAPILMTMLKGTKRPNLSVIAALGDLNCGEAVPILIEQFLDGQPKPLSLDTIVRALANIEDERSTRALKEFVAGDFPKKEQSVARRPLVIMNSRNPIQDLLDLLEKETNNSECSELIYALSKYDDPRVIERLTVITRTSDTAFLRIMAMHGLCRIGNRSSLLAVASMLDHQFPENLKTSDYKGHRDYPEHLPERFAESLRRATQQDFGKDRAKWEAWIRANVD